MTPFRQEYSDDEPDDEIVPKVTSKVYWARRRAAARFACIVEGHLTDPDEVDENGQAPCLRCGRWIYVD